MPSHPNMAHNIANKYKSAQQQVQEILLLGHHKHMLPHEYYEFGLDYEHRTEIDTYMGIILSRELWATHQVKDLNCFFDDKLYTAIWLNEFGLDQPKYYSAFHCENKKEDLQTVIMKDRTGSGGKGVWRLDLSLPENIENLVLLSEQPVEECQYIFQEDLKPCGTIQNLMNIASSPNAVPSLRVTIMNGVVLHTLIRVSLDNDGVVDNYSQGNGAVATVYDFEKIGVLHTDLRLENNMYRSIVASYSSGNLPFAKETKNLVDRLIAVLNNHTKGDPYFVGVDIIVSQDGPKIIEINTRPGLRMIQVAEQRGFADVIAPTIDQQKINLEKSFMDVPLVNPYAADVRSYKID